MKGFALLVPILILTSPAVLQGSSAAISPVAVDLVGADRPTAIRFVGSTRQGHVLALDGERWSFRQLMPKRTEEVRLEVLPSARPGFVLDAALGSGGEWLVLTADGAPTLRLFEASKEKAIPDPGGWVRAVGFLRGAPVIALAPISMGQNMITEERSARPLLKTLDGSSWRPLVDYELSPEQLMELLRTKEGCAVCAFGDTVLVEDAKHSRTWLVQRAIYRVRGFDGRGQLVADVRAGEQQVSFRGRTASEQQAATDRARTIQGEGQKQALMRLSASGVPKRSIQAAAWYDDALYLLIPAAGDTDKVNLDRLDPSTDTVERVELSWSGYSGTVSMVATPDGLLLAPYEANAGAWLLRREDLELASWKPVTGAEFVRIKGR